MMQPLKIESMLMHRSVEESSRVTYATKGTLFLAKDCLPYLVDKQQPLPHMTRKLQYVDYIRKEQVPANFCGLLANLPMSLLTKALPVKILRIIGHMLCGLKFQTRTSKTDIINFICSHKCVNCKDCVTLLIPHVPVSAKLVEPINISDMSFTDVNDYKFPPEPLTASQSAEAVTDFVAACSAENIEEVGCLCCGMLVKKKDTVPQAEVEGMLHLLETSDPFIARLERLDSNKPLRVWEGPVIDLRCSRCCKPCANKLSNKKVPKHALSRGSWIGNVPPELQNLSYAEKVLVSRVRTNRHIFRVASSGMHKIVANAVTF
jgi:hypothetical protein